MSPLHPAVYRKLLAFVVGFAVLMVLKYLERRFDLIVPGLDAAASQIALDGFTGLAIGLGIYHLPNAKPGTPSE